MDRRGFLTGLGLIAVAAPAIVRASSLMAVKPLPDDRFDLFEWRTSLDGRVRPEHLAFNYAIEGSDDGVNFTEIGIGRPTRYIRGKLIFIGKDEFAVTGRINGELIVPPAG